MSASRTAASAPASARQARPTRGRPARLSRDGIVDSVLRMIQRAPDESITLKRIGREIGAAPAALYRHFDNLDDLLDCVLARVLADVGPGPGPSASWQQQLSGWMQALRSRLLAAPAVIALIGRAGRTSPAWLEASSSLVGILEGAGLSGASLTATYLWVLETTVGLVMQEAALPFADQLGNARASSHALSEEARARIAPLFREMETLDADAFFAFSIERVVSAIERMSAGDAPDA